MYPITKIVAVVAVSLTGVTIAVPTNPSPPTYYGLTQISKFDNIMGAPGVTVSPVGNNGIAYNLFWKGFSLSDTEQPNLPATAVVLPQSNPNVIAFGTDDVQTIQQGTPQISVYYPESQIAYFDLSYFYYGCTTGTELSVAAEPLSCVITATAFSPQPNSKQVGQAKFSFVADGLTQNMNLAVLPASFKSLGSVLFNVTATTQLPLTLATAGLIDTVGNTIYSTERLS